MNQILGDNAVRAGQRLPPLALNEVDERANNLLNRRCDFSKKTISVPSSTLNNRTQWFRVQFGPIKFQTLS